MLITSTLLLPRLLVLGVVELGVPDPVSDRYEARLWISLWPIDGPCHRSRESTLAANSLPGTNTQGIRVVLRNATVSGVTVL